jgi:hypothetical protein
VYEFEESENGNFVCRDEGEVICTVFHRGGYWKWVINLSDGPLWSPYSYRSHTEALAAADQNLNYHLGR